MRSGSEEGEKIVKIFFDIFFKEMNEETAKLVVGILKKFGITKSDIEFKDCFNYLMKDITEKKIDILEKKLNDFVF